MDSVISSILNGNSRVVEDESALVESLRKLADTISKSHSSVYMKVFWRCHRKLKVGILEKFQVDVLVLPTVNEDHRGVGFEILARCETNRGGLTMSHWEREIDGISEPLSTKLYFTAEEIMDLYAISEGLSPELREALGVESFQ